MKTVGRVALIVLAVLAVAALGGFWWLRSSGRPVRGGEHAVPGLTGAVTVRFDRWGVPHVDAPTAADAFAALGYLHANDRFTQMELGRRAAFGRLSEILGEATVYADVYFRTLRLPETVEKLWQTASPETRSALEAYAAGVNAWLTERGSDLPPELRLLRGEVEPWRPADSTAFALLMAEDLSFWQGRPEEERFLWLRALGADAVRELLAEPELAVPAEILELAQRGGAPAAGAAPGPGAGNAAPGSNNWAVGGSRTASGRAMIANDPHLGLALPSIWYQVMIRSPEYEAAGMTLPGAPGVVLGRGPHVAWAFTNTMLDDHDVFFEELDDTGERYRRGDLWKPLAVTQETIRIRGGESRTVTLRATDLGPLLDADPAQGLPPRSLAWTAYEGGDPLAALFALSRATTVDEVLAAVEGYVCPAQNLVAAFDSGELMFTVIGRVPNRRIEIPATGGDEAADGDAAADPAEAEGGAGAAPAILGAAWGRLPSPGWNAAYGWDGTRPRSTNPTVVRPADGVIVTANHDVRPPGYPLSLVSEFYVPYRHDRIVQLLEERDQLDVAAFTAVQTDVVSLYARDLVAALAGDYEGDAQRAYAALAGWDGAMELHGPSALYVLLTRHLFTGLFGDEAAAAKLRPFANGDRVLNLLQGAMAPRWFDDVSTPETEGRQEILQRALAGAWAEGRQRWGNDVARWDYGWLHSLTLRHRLDALPVLGRFMRRGPYPSPGSATTVAAFGAVWRGERQDVTYGPSMRWIVDWGQNEQAFAVLPGGQSGHFADRHYDDQIAPYFAGELHPAPWSEAAVAAAAVSELRLVPAAR